MKTLTALALTCAAIATPALAQQTKTVTIDTPRYDGTRTVTQDDGTLTRDTDLTRKSDGATASSDFERQRTEDGVTRERTTTGFNGQTSSTSYERERTAHGWVASGEHVQRDGDVVGYHARGVHTPGAVARRQRVLLNGETVGSRRTIRRR